MDLYHFGGDGDFDQVFENPFGIFEIGLKPKIGGREGTYRFYTWINDTFHESINNSQEDRGMNFGYGISFDQKLTEGMGAFARFGVQNKEVSPFDRSWSLGLQLNGSRFKRPKDILGIAFGMTQPGKGF